MLDLSELTRIYDRCMDFPMQHTVAVPFISV